MVMVLIGLSLCANVRADQDPGQVNNKVPTSLLTVAEKTDYRGTSTYREVMDFCESLARMSPLVHLTDMGTSTEGRKLPLLILADPPIKSPEEAAKSGKLIVMAQGDIHAGEVDGKEALLMLARDLVTRPRTDLFQHLIILIAPIFNPDGNDRMAMTHRPGQVGPALGMGIRHNAQDLDLNRDFVKLETPEVRALVQCFTRWDPAVFIDTHTTNGCFHRYLITYDGPRSATVDERLVQAVRDRYLPAAGQCLTDHDGYKAYFYGDFTPDHTRWETYPPLPRYGIQYVGFRNRIAILSESYSYASYRDRVLAGLGFVRCCFEYASVKSGELKKLLQTLDDATKEAGDNPQPAVRIALRQKSVPFGGPRPTLGFVEAKRDGRTVSTGQPHDYETVFVGLCEPTRFAQRPYAYLVPASLGRVLSNLHQQGIACEELREDVDLEVSIAKVTKVHREATPFQRHNIVNLETVARTETQRVPAGTIIVRTGQKLGTLAGYLLEPESEDGLVAWNFLDAQIQDGADYPIWRLMKPATLLAAPWSADTSAAAKTVTLDSVYGPRGDNFVGTPVTGLTWLPGGREYVQVLNQRLWATTAVTGSRRSLVDATKLAGALASLPGIESKIAQELAGQTSLQLNPAADGAVFNHKDRLYFAKLDGSAARCLTEKPAEREEVAFSPDGKWISFTEKGNLYVVNIDRPLERQLTTDGAPKVSSGRADWVYFEEVFNRNHRAYWWSPDSQLIAFLRFDDQPVHEFAVIDEIPPLQNVELTPYPRAGDPNPHVTLGIVDAAGGNPRWVDLTDYPAEDRLIVHVGWTPDSKEVFYYVQNRVQTWLDFLLASAGDQKPNKLFRETTKAWVDNPGEPKFLKDGSFILPSERTGWKHFYHFDRDGREPQAITSGPWEARSLERIDEATGHVFFSGTKDSPIASNLYRVNLGGTGLERVSQGSGDHHIQFSPNGDLFLDSVSSFTAPMRVYLRQANDRLVRTVDTNPVRGLSQFRFGRSELVHIPLSDGFVLEGSLTYPPDFDPSQRYPVWFMTYGGPHTPTVRDAWTAAVAQDQALAARGIVVFHCDPRGASGKGAGSAWTMFHQLGVQELRDIEEAIDWLVATHPYVDARRIGMSGHSYGGFMTSFTLTHSKKFAAGIAGAPVTDWHDYDTIYTERYMDVPSRNREGYEKTSVVKAATNLHGRLLLLHGLMDDNVHLQNSAQLILELQKADKPFELMIYPRSRHPILGLHYRRTWFDFASQSIGARVTP
jgi:dipeptidyl aminopeptidase/acylaminoacyl peptidase